MRFPAYCSLRAMAVLWEALLSGEAAKMRANEGRSPHLPLLLCAPNRKTTVLRRLRVLTLNSDWSVRLFIAVVIGQCRKQPRFQGIFSSGPLERSCVIYFLFLLLAVGGEPL